MCELLALSSLQSATVSFSLTQFAAHGGLTGPHKDGWGIGYYHELDVCLIKEAHAAADSDWVKFIQDHGFRSHLIISHIRRATVGKRTFSNTQPFTRELGGHQHLFAHNGDLDLSCAQPKEAQRFNPIGQTDSELAFCQLMNQLQVIWDDVSHPPPIDQRLAIVNQFASRIRDLGPANFLYTDGEVLFAHGHRRTQHATGSIQPPGLVWLQRQCKLDQAGFVTEGLSIENNDQQIGLIASVPLTDEHWMPFAEGEIIGMVAGQVIVRQLPDAEPVWS